MPIPRDQLRLREQDRAELLETTRTLHCATVSPEGLPHVVPLWFVWLEGAVWVNTLRRSRRNADLAAGSPVAICVDAGVEYGELRGLTAGGRFEKITDEALLIPVRQAFGAKYWHGVDVPNVRSHDWLRFLPDREASWDFRRINEAGEDPRLRALDAKEQRRPGDGRGTTIR